MAHQKHSKDPKRNRLQRAVCDNYRWMRSARSVRASLIEKYAGTLYPDLRDDDYQDIVNYTRQAGEAQTLTLATNRPRFLCTSNDPDVTGQAHHLRRTLDNYAKRIRLEKPLGQCALDGYFGTAIAKVCLHEWSWPDQAPREFATFGWPNVIRVSYDHFVYDTEAPDWDCVSFFGDRYRRRLDDVLENPNFLTKARKEIERLGESLFHQNESEDWAENIAKTEDVTHRYDPWVYLADIYTPEDRHINTYVVDFNFDFLLPEPINKEPVVWDGKETGPHCILNFGRVPDNTKSSSPAQQLLLQHNFNNTMWRKLEQQTEQAKHLGLVGNDNEADLPKFRDAENGEWISASNPQAAEVKSFDGPDQAIFALLMAMEQRLSKRAGNLEHKLGLGADAETAAQESMISANISQVDAAYAERYVEFVREIAREIGRLIYQDAALRIPQTLTVPGSDIQVNDDWLPTTDPARGPDKMDVLEIDIDPYSLPYTPPGKRAAMLRHDINTFLPALEVLGQMGVQMDLASALEELAHLENRPELKKLFKFNQPPPEPNQQNAHRRTLPSNTQREYLHRNVSGGTMQGNQHAEMMQALSAAGSQGNGNGKSSGY